MGQIASKAPVGEANQVRRRGAIQSHSRLSCPLWSRNSPRRNRIYYILGTASVAAVRRRRYAELSRHRAKRGGRRSLTYSGATGWPDCARPSCSSHGLGPWRPLAPKVFRGCALGVRQKLPAMRPGAPRSGLIRMARNLRPNRANQTQSNRIKPIYDSVLP